MLEISLVQPSHNNSPAEGEGHIYCPSSLLVAGARIMAAGGDVDFQDGNLRSVDLKRDVIGVNVVGAPYIPIVLQLRDRIKSVVAKDFKLLLGGQVVDGLAAQEFNDGKPSKDFVQLFGPNVFNGNDDETLKRVVGLQLLYLPPPEKTSLIPAYEKISDADFEKYMRHEFSLYLSQGCKYRCEFCAAKHTIKNPVTGELISVKEQYRHLAIVEEELKYMVERAQRLGITSFDIYLSNLDIFQTPEKLKEFARIVVGIKRQYADFTFRMRGLSTTGEFMKVYRTDRDVIQLMVDAGLWSIGFGVDGTSSEVWKACQKPNSLNDCIDAIRLTRNEFDIIPEFFMVVGHPADTLDTLADAVMFAQFMQEKYGAVPRPYVAKSFVPGSPGWHHPVNRSTIDFLLQHPEYFQCFEYAAYANPITHHGNVEMIKPINNAYRQLLEIGGNTTRPVYPLSPENSSEENEWIMRVNLGQYDR